MRVLDVGGGDKARDFPPEFEGWEHVVLDINPGPGVGLVMDARNLTALAPSQFDAVYCSHNLEHYYLHEVPAVLAGVRHVMKPDAFIEIRVPDMMAVFLRVIVNDLDIESAMCESPAGVITAHDIVYGWGKALAQGNLAYAHRCGFSRRSLERALCGAGFHGVGVRQVPETLELRARAVQGWVRGRA